jgi:hypothetical protein
MSDFAALTPAALRNDKRTSGTLRCNPPNRKCGNRCIPPSWDCRLRGEGNDNHLKAAGKGSDPIAGFANIERGISRIGKGAVKLSFTEIEGGRRALARGAAKLSPGDLQKKKELQQTVYNYGLAVGAPVTVAIFAALSHKGLKSFRGYREGPGRQIDEAAGSAFRTVARNMPFGVGENVRAREATGPNAVRATAAAMTNYEARTPAAVTQRAATGDFLRRTVAAQRTNTTDAEGAAAIVRQLRSVDTLNNGAPSKLGYSEWEDRSLQAFWATPRTQSMTPEWAASGEGTSLFASTATNNLLSRSFGITPKPNLPLKTQTLDVVNNIAMNLRSSGARIRTSMSQAGLDASSPEVVRSYIRSVPLGINLPANAQSRLYETLEVAVTSSDYTTQARSFYNSTLQGYDQFFRGLSTSVTERPGIRNPDRARSFWRDGTLAHAEVLARRIGFDVGPITDTGTATVVKKAYHGAKVMTEKRVFKTSVALTSREALTAASELARSRGLQEPSNVADSLSLLNSLLAGGNDLNPTRLRDISLVRPPAPERGAPPPIRPALPPARRRSAASRLADIRRERNPDGTLRYATLEAAQAELLRRQGRTDAARLDYTDPSKRTGKPCGKSFVKRERKCSKPTSRGYADKPQPRPGATPRGRRTYPAGYIPNRIKHSHSVSKETSKKISGIAEKAAKVAAVAGVIGGGVIAARKGRQLVANRRNNQTYTKYAPQAVNKAITRLSQKDVSNAVARVPSQFRPQAEKLLGKAKAALAYVQADAQGYDLTKVNNDSNFSVWRNSQSDKVLTIGSVGDTLITFSADRTSTVDLRTENGRGVGVYDVQFASDLGFQQKTGLNKESSSQITKMLRSMNTDTMANLPSNAVLRNVPYGKDGLGNKREAIYKRYGYKSLNGVRGNAMFAVMENGKVSKIKTEYEDFYADLIKGDDYETAASKFATRQRRGDSAAAQSAPGRFKSSKVRPWGHAHPDHAAPRGRIQRPQARSARRQRRLPPSP